MARPGGPAELSDEQRKVFFDSLRVPGMSRDLAAIRAGIEPRTLYRWLARAKAKASGKAKADQPYRQFRQEMLRVEADAETGALAVIAKAGQPRKVTVTRTTTGPKSTVITTEERTEDGDWRALAFILERRKPKKYARRDETTVKGDKEFPLVFTPATGGKPGTDGRRPKAAGE